MKVFNVTLKRNKLVLVKMNPREIKVPSAEETYTLNPVCLYTHSLSAA